MSKSGKYKFDIHMRHDLLARSARETLHSAIEASQVSQRMKRLLPAMRMERKRQLRGRLFSAAKSERLALTDQDYIDFIDSYIEAKSKAIRDRVMSDSYFRLLAARQSLRKFRSNEPRN